MKILKQTLKVLILVIGSILILTGLYFTAAYFLSRIVVNEDTHSDNEITAYLLSNGVHTDIIVPVRTSVIDWSLIVKPEFTRAQDSTPQWLAFGWGDKGFYLETPTWDDLTFSTAFKAGFALGGSAMHATFHKEITLGEKCKILRLSTNEYKKLVQYIQNSFILDSDGHVINIKTDAVYGNNDAFYEANGRYNLFHTCNSWTNSALKSCNQKACLWTPFESGIMQLYNDDK